MPRRQPRNLALFSLGDLASPLFESELRSVILFGSNPVASSLSYSDGVRSPILNRARQLYESGSVGLIQNDCTKASSWLNHSY